MGRGYKNIIFIYTNIYSNYIFDGYPRAFRVYIYILEAKV